MRREDLELRHRIEQDFHDAKARQGVDDFYGFGALSAADAYLWSVLGDLRGKHLLELGCGDGAASVLFARAGAKVTAIDISGEMVDLARGRAAREGLSASITTSTMSGEAIDFPDGCFDIVYGHSILHHLNLDLSVPRIAHVLRRGGVAAFLEPLGYNPILGLFRILTPHRRTPTERPLRVSQLESIAEHFSTWDHEEFYLVSLAAFFWYYGVKSRRLFQSTQKVLVPVDRFLFGLIPALARLAWITVVRYTK